MTSCHEHGNVLNRTTEVYFSSRVIRKLSYLLIDETLKKYTKKVKGKDVGEKDRYTSKDGIFKDQSSGVRPKKEEGK